MTETSTDTSEPATHEVAIQNPDTWRPPAEPVKIYGPGPDGAREAGRDLAESRAKPAPIKVWRDDDESDDLKDLSPHAAARKQASKITLSRRMADGERLVQATGARSGSAAEFVGATVRERALTDGEPVIREYADKDAQPNIRQAAKDLTQGRAADAPEAQARDEQFQEIVSLLNGDEELARQTLGEQQTPTEQPVEQQQPAQPDPAIIEARQRAEYAAQALQNLHQLSHAEIVIGHQMEQMNQQRIAAGINTMEDVARLPPDQQQKWAAFSDQFGKLELQRQHAANQRELVARRVADAHAAEQATARQQQQAQYARWEAAQNQIAEEAIPELRDERHGHAFRKAAHETLAEYLGITPETARNLRPEYRQAMRYSGFQKLLADAARYRLGKQRAMEASSRQLPQVQRPGVRQDKGSRGAADLASLDRKIDTARQGSAAQLRAAARLLAESRRTAQRGR